jgi:hypothetical protein
MTYIKTQNVIHSLSPTKCSITCIRLAIEAHFNCFVRELRVLGGIARRPMQPAVIARFLIETGGKPPTTIRWGTFTRRTRGGCDGIGSVMVSPANSRKRYNGPLRLIGCRQIVHFIPSD